MSPTAAPLNALKSRLSSWRQDPGAAEDRQQVLRVEAEETLRVSFTVNGRPAEVDVAPRVTLSDALRDHLGLTGTHIGCEHGVCGMCTVIVDGDAARACLLLACQLEGAEIMTVEGLGKPDDLHPLQESFSRHHALQCGFCTPGMLMSAYDLLDHEPGVAQDELPEKMSGVLCRCTGYRHIMDAVSDVAQQNPEGVPAPRNCGTGQLLPRSNTGGPGSSAEDELQSRGPAEITLPSSQPTVTVSVEEHVQATPEEIWEVLQDTDRVARCLPGAELVEDFGNDRYLGRIRVALGPVKLSFVGDIHVTERDEQNRSIRAVAQAEDAAGGSVQAAVALAAKPHEGGSLLSADAELFMVGKIAQMGRSLAGDVSADMFAQFTQALDATARGEEPTQAQAPSAVAMFTRLMSQRAQSLVDRLRRR